MKKYYLFFLLLLFSVTFSCHPVKEQNENKKTIILIDPTVKKLTNIKYIIDNKFIDIHGLKIIGLYNSKQKYDFSESDKFIKANHMDYVALKGIYFNINYDSLFFENSCSATFHNLFKQSDGIFFLGGTIFLLNYIMKRLPYKHKYLHTKDYMNYHLCFIFWAVLKIQLINLF